VFVYKTIFFINLESLFDTEKYQIATANYEFQSFPYVGLLNKAFMAAYIYTIAVQAEIISLILYHNSTFIIANLSKHDEISFVVGSK
jgi:hypothetical protein